MTALIAELVDGPLDIIGDVHGEPDVLRVLLDHLGYERDGTHPAGRTVVFLGDLIDRGPDSPAVIELVRALIECGRAQCILGNHELNALRHGLTDGVVWPFDQGHAASAGERVRRRPAPAEHTYQTFFQSLPIVLERADLRLVHAAWVPSAIEALRTARGTSLELFNHHEAKAIEDLDQPGGIGALARAEKDPHRAALRDPTTRPPPLPNLAQYESLKQARNPVRVLTSGPECVAAQPFYVNKQWRLCDRERWWTGYTDDIPVIVGHYWRIGDHDGEPGEDAVGTGRSYLFAGHPPHAWMGASRNVFCVDFSIGGRHTERARGTTPFRTRLAAVRWPERMLVFDDGEARAMEPGFSAD